MDVYEYRERADRYSHRWVGQVANVLCGRWTSIPHQCSSSAASESPPSPHAYESLRRLRHLRSQSWTKNIYQASTNEDGISDVIRPSVSRASLHSLIRYVHMSSASAVAAAHRSNHIEYPMSAWPYIIYQPNDGAARVEAVTRVKTSASSCNVNYHPFALRLGHIARVRPL